ELVDEAILRQRISEADRLVRIAEGQAKTLSDNKLRAAMTTQRLEVEKLVKQWETVEKARQALAGNPDDAAAALADGRYRCLAEGDWKAGLELIARGSDERLKHAAALDLAGTSQEIAAAKIGDAWHQIASSDESLAGFFARALHWYRLQAGGSETLEQARIQQRMEQIEALKLPPRLLDQVNVATANAPLPPFYPAFTRVYSFGPVDLFNFVQRTDLSASPWAATNDMPPALYSDADAALARLPARYPPPREYQLTIRVRRGRPTSGAAPAFPLAEPEPTGPFVIGLVGPKSPFLACLDLPIGGGEFGSFLTTGEAAAPQDNPTLRRLSSAQISGRFRGESTIVCQVRRRSVSVMVDSTEACRYEGDLAKLSLPKEWSINDPRSLFIGSHKCCYSVTSWMLEPLPAESRVPASTAGFSAGAAPIDF
ncbi:MAG TPA: hypothetical protein VFV87_00360, partial [Pirellulaceae bacterium]|nr:hypothetical protein [Pirellulaceae bacterium]